MKYSTSEFAQTFVFGVGTGYSWANVENVRAKRPPLYCQPPKMPMNAAMYNGLLSAFLQKHVDNGTLDSTRPVELYLLDSLKESFPCK